MPAILSKKNPGSCREKFGTCRLILRLVGVAAGFVFGSNAFAADPGKLVVQVDKPGAKLGPLFYGISSEEINFSPVVSDPTGSALGLRPNAGFRTDIMQLLADLKPGFLR